MGKPKDERVWKHYGVIEIKSVKCHYCDKKYKIGNVNRMCKHLIKCFKCPEIIRKEMNKNNLCLKGIQMQTRSENVPPEENQSCDFTNEEPSINRNYSNMSTESQNMPSTSFSSGVEQAGLAEKLARTIIVSGASMSLIEHPLWIEFFSYLQPSFKLPSRKALSTKYLNQIYNEIKKEVKEELDTVNYLHLQLDGWSNIYNEGIINFIISKPESFLVESLNTEQPHTYIYLREEILKVMRTYGEEKFVVLISKNAKNIQKAFQLVKEVQPHVVPLNCAAHTINLLVRDVVKCNGVNYFIERCLGIIKLIKKSQVLGSKLQQIVKQKKTGGKLKLPCCTRWGTYLTSLRSLKNTKAALLALVLEEDTNMSNDTKYDLLNNTFWNYVNECISVLEPITEPIFQLESNKCNVHTVFMIFKDIKFKLSLILPNITFLKNRWKNEILSAVAIRMNDCIEPLHLSAYLLDPKTRGIDLNQNEELKAMNFINKMAGLLNVKVMPELAAYKSKEGFWGNPFIWENINEITPLTWWKGICSSTKLSKVAVRILSAPCTSTATERSFSTHTNIHSKKINRLTTEKAAKITLIKYNWNTFNKIQKSPNSDGDKDVPSPCPVQTGTNEKSVDLKESRSDSQFVNCTANNDEQSSISISSDSYSDDSSNNDSSSDDSFNIDNCSDDSE